ncbi:MAG: dihydroorotase [Proteobacteria bacterium]|nr:dihydroorotase [Pseudomonadota bacterium]MDA1331105.1 dihydroorotase [Pseudomonadota bacterium]
MDELLIRQPDDLHIHLRDGDLLPLSVDHVSAQFGRAIVMPNLSPPIVSTPMAAAYRDRILSAVPAGRSFNPLMTLYLTDRTMPSEVLVAKESGIIHGVKYYPAGATTNSDSGVTDLSGRYDVLEAMMKHGMPLLLHGEVTDKHVDVFDREKVFLDVVLSTVVKRFPELKIVLEHITTADSVQFVDSCSDKVAATITAHHLLLNRSDLFSGGIRPHHYCLPILKREEHRLALIRAAVSGSPKYFLGTDSAPHEKHTKEAACGCAGVYTAHAALELYAAAFDSVGAIDKLEKFTSAFGAKFYGLPLNVGQIRLLRKRQEVLPQYSYPGGSIVPFRAGETLDWSISTD